MESDRAGRKVSVGERRLKENYRQILIFSLWRCWLLFQMYRGDNTQAAKNCGTVHVYQSWELFDFHFCSNKKRCDYPIRQCRAGDALQSLISDPQIRRSSRTRAAQGPVSFVFNTGIIQNLKDELLQQRACTEITWRFLNKFSFNEAERVLFVTPEPQFTVQHLLTLLTTIT